jgi:hypothetical protein
VLSVAALLPWMESLCFPRILWRFNRLIRSNVPLPEQDALTAKTEFYRAPFINGGQPGKKSKVRKNTRTRIKTESLNELSRSWQKLELAFGPRL